MCESLYCYEFDLFVRLTSVLDGHWEASVSMCHDECHFEPNSQTCSDYLQEMASNEKCTCPFNVFVTVLEASTCHMTLRKTLADAGALVWVRIQS